MQKSTANIQIQNLQGRFAQLYTAKAFRKIPELFSRSEACYVCPDEHLNLCDYSAVEKYFISLAEEAEKEPGIAGLYPLLNNPIVRLNGDTRAQGCWTSHAFLIEKQQDGLTIEYGIRRFDGDFVLEEDGWKIAKLNTFYFSSLVPKEYSPEQEGGLAALGRAHSLPPEASPASNAADYLKIQQILSEYCQNRRETAMELFSQKEEIRLELEPMVPLAMGRTAVAEAFRNLSELEERNGGRCCMIPMLESPVIEIGPDGTAQATFHMLSHEIKGEAFGHQESYCPVLTRICLLRAELIRENGAWKLLSLQGEHIFTLPAFRYDREESRGMCMELPGSKWMDMPASTGCSVEGHEDDILDIESVIALWTGSIRHRSFGRLVYERCAWERPDLTDGKLLCRQIFGMTDSFYKEQPKYPGFHCGMSPYVQIDEDKNTAVATWLDFGYTSVGEKFGYTSFPWYAKPGISRYQISFVKSGEIWKITRFDWKPFFRMDYQKYFWLFDYARAKGWVGSASPKRFPLPFEEYEYSEERYYPGMEGFALEAPEISCPLEKQVGKTVGYDVLARYSGFTSRRPIPRKMTDSAGNR